MSDSVNHPSHYASGKIEVIEAIEDWGFGPGFWRGNAIKYAARAGKKDPTKTIEDLEKAVWYLKREIEVLKARKENRETTRPNAMNTKSKTSELSSVTDVLDSSKVGPSKDTASAAHKFKSITAECDDDCPICLSIPISGG